MDLPAWWVSIFLQNTLSLTISSIRCLSFCCIPKVAILSASLYSSIVGSHRDVMPFSLSYCWTECSCLKQRVHCIYIQVRENLTRLLKCWIVSDIISADDLFESKFCSIFRHFSLQNTQINSNSTHVHNHFTVYLSSFPEV